MGQEDYFRMYEETACAIKSVDSQFRVGGPASARGEWVKDFVRFVDKNDIPCDFISTHIYPDDEDFFTTDKDYPGVYKGEDYVSSLVTMNYEIAQSSKRKIPIYWTEYNSSWRFCVMDREGSNQAAFICKTIHQVHGKVRSFAYWVVSDVYDEGGFPRSAFQGLFGLINFNGLPKASYNAYRLLKMLGDQEVEVKSEGLDGRFNVWAAKNEANGEAQILVYHWQPPKVEPLSEKTVEINLEGLCKEGERKYATVYIIDERHSNVFTAWQAMGSPENLTDEQIRILKDKSGLETEKSQTLVGGENGILNLKVSLKPGSVALYKMQ